MDCVKFTQHNSDVSSHSEEIYHAFPRANDLRLGTRLATLSRRPARAGASKTATILETERRVLRHSCVYVWL